MIGRCDVAEGSRHEGSKSGLVENESGLRDAGMMSHRGGRGSHRGGTSDCHDDDVVVNETVTNLVTAGDFSGDTHPRHLS